MQISKSVRSGFTLIEMLVVLAIMGILIAVITPAYTGYKRRAARQATIGSMRVITMALEQYKEDIGEYPQLLRDLVKKPTDEKGAANWTEPYIKSKEEPKDGFGNKFHYSPTPGAENPYELSSYGPNGKGAPKNEWIDAWKQ